MNLERIVQFLKIHRTGLILSGSYHTNKEEKWHVIPWRRKVARQQWNCHGIVGMYDNYRYDDAISHARPTMSSSLDRVLARARSNDSLMFESKQGVLQRCIPWRCSVFSLGAPFFATRAKRATAAVVVAATLRTVFVFSQLHSIRSTGAISWSLSIYFSEYISEKFIVLC